MSSLLLGETREGGEGRVRGDDGESDKGRSNHNNNEDMMTVLLWLSCHHHHQVRQGERAREGQGEVTVTRAKAHKLNPCPYP